MLFDLSLAEPWLAASPALASATAVVVVVVVAAGGAAGGGSTVSLSLSSSSSSSLAAFAPALGAADAATASCAARCAAAAASSAAFLAAAAALVATSCVHVAQSSRITPSIDTAQTRDKGEKKKRKISSWLTTRRSRQKHTGRSTTNAPQRHARRTFRRDDVDGALLAHLLLLLRRPGAVVVTRRYGIAWCAHDFLRASTQTAKQDYD